MSHGSLIFPMAHTLLDIGQKDHPLAYSLSQLLIHFNFSQEIRHLGLFTLTSADKTFLLAYLGLIPAKRTVPLAPLASPWLTLGLKIKCILKADLAKLIMKK